MIFQHTRDMEGAVRALAAKYDRVLIRNKNLCWNPIRFRRKKIADLEPRIVLNSVAWDSQLAEWNAHGGLLIYDRSFMLTENVAAHHAQLVIECPFSVEVLMEYAQGTREECIVYLPPHWREHERSLNTLCPNGELCKRFDILAHAAPELPFRNLLKLGPCTALSDEDAAAALGIVSAEMHRLRAILYRKRDFTSVTRVILRHPPDDRSLSAVFERIEEFPEIDGVRMIVGNGLQKATRYWKKALRDLDRRGCAKLLDTLYCYFQPEVPINFKNVDAKRARAWRQFEEVKAYVTALPEFIPQERLGPLSPAPAARVPQSLSASS